MKKFLIIACLTGAAFSMSIGVSAQDAVHGTITAGSGVGTATPWEGDVRLTIPTSVVRIAPYINISGITHNSSEMDDDRLYRYSKSGNLYESSQELQSEGYNLKYGTTALFTLGTGSLNVLFDGQRHQQETTGRMSESVVDTQHNRLSRHEWNMTMPCQDWNQYRTGACYSRKGFHVEYTYQYRKANEEFEQMATDLVTGFGGREYVRNLRNSDTKEHNHQARVSQAFHPAKGQQLTAGLGFVRNSVGRELDQWLDGANQPLLENHASFNHRYQTQSAFVEYRFANAAIKALARLEYANTHMRYTKATEDRANRSWNLNDLIPQIHLDWAIHEGDTITADYRMIVKRPDIEVLDPVQIFYGAHAVDYGNADLEGIHINNVSLAYHIHRDRFDYTTTLGGIIVEDGFNAIWMEKDNIRISTWGNEGVRRAYSVTPRLRWQAAARTTFTAQTTLLWDKRIARAISMQKEHWGITAQAAIVQVLAPGCILNLHGQYSEGNTIDLYSHESRSYGAGASLKKALSPSIDLTLGYDYREHAKAILTQGQYTGRVDNRPGSRHNAWLNVSYKL